MLVKILYFQHYSHQTCDLLFSILIGSSLVFEAGGVAGATPQKYNILSCLFVAAPQKLYPVWF